MTEQADRDVLPLLPESRFEDMSREELAMDWAYKVAAVPTLVLDSYVITEEGRRLTQEAREEYRAQFTGLPDPTPEEAKERDVEWRAVSQAIIDADPSVIEKNRFIAMLAEPNHPRAPTATIKLLAELRKAAEFECTPMTYVDQFLGLWAVYKAGQASERTSIG